MTPFHEQSWWIPVKFHPKKRPRKGKGGVMVSMFQENRQNEEAIRNGLIKAGGSLPKWMPHAGHFDVIHVFCFKSTDQKKHPYMSRYKGTCDGDNLEKAVWDALNEIIWQDDSWISCWSSRKIYWKEDGIYLRVRFYE